MLKGNKALVWLMVCITSLGVMTLPGCGGGGGGGGGTELPGFVALAGQVFFGTRDGGLDDLQPFPSVPAQGVPVPMGGTQNVPPSNFAAGGVNRQDFIQLSFNVPLDATTIQSGITVFDISTSGVATPVNYLLDSQGTLDPGNAFPSPGVTPATLRLYVSSDALLSTPESFNAGTYSLEINTNLRGFNGGGFCTVPVGSSCATANTYLPQRTFSVGADNAEFTTRGAPSGIGASNITQNDSSVALNSEIHLNFNKAIAFESLVGAANLSTLDPFITQPFSLAANGSMCVAPPQFGLDIGSLFIAYTAPTDPVTTASEQLPANLGVVVYMPDPILNPTQIRIRFVDITNLVGVDNVAGAQFQNYASNPVKLPVPSNDPARNGASLTLPAVQVVPGSLPGYDPNLGVTDQRAAFVTVVVNSPTSTTGPPFMCSMPTGTAQDRSGNGFAFNATTQDYRLDFVFAEGAALARNPQFPDCHVVAATQQPVQGIGMINVGAAVTSLGGAGTNLQAPVWAGTGLTGNISLEPNRLANSNVLGTPLDVEVGAWIRTQTTGVAGVQNHITNPARGSVGRPGVPDNQNGTTPAGLRELVGASMPPFPPLQPLGNFLYVIDGDSQEVKVFNSYNFQFISSITGLNTPGGLGISPDLEFLYVSNRVAGTVSRVFANPLSPTFNTIAGTFTVGAGPTAIAVQPGNEDLFVCNTADNSFSLITAATGVERARFADSGAVGPVEVFAGLRMLGQGLTNAYTAYILNLFSNNLTIYESDSPAVLENSVNGVVKATIGGFAGPRRGCWNWITYIGGVTEPGVFIANTQDTRVDELTMQSFTLSPPPGFPGPGGMRNFRILKSYPSLGVPGAETAEPSDVSIETLSGLYNFVASGSSNNKGFADPSAGAGTPSQVLVSYPAAGVVGVWDYTSPTVRGSASVPGCDFMHSYYDQ